MLNGSHSSDGSWEAERKKREDSQNPLHRYTLNDLISFHQASPLNSTMFQSPSPQTHRERELISYRAMGNSPNHSARGKSSNPQHMRHSSQPQCRGTLILMTVLQGTHSSTLQSHRTFIQSTVPWNTHPKQYHETLIPTTEPGDTDPSHSAMRHYSTYSGMGH